jgi:hypothetical protein
MTFIVVSFRGKELMEGKHKYGNTDRRLKGEGNDTETDVQTDRLTDR